MKKKLVISLLIILPLITFYLLGPHVEAPDLNAKATNYPNDLQKLEAKINSTEAANDKIKPDNEARIVWADSGYNKTEYSFVYLHGWSASQEEGAPLHEEIAKRYGYNLYLPRLAGHGLSEEEPMLNLTATDLMKSAREAIAVGKKIGDKVIVIATSTGGTLALYLASQNKDIHSMVLYSPNIDMRDQSSVLLNKPWGLQLARLVKSSNYYQWELDSPRVQYWTNKYRLEALTQLRELVDDTMKPEVFQNVKQPVFMGYYFKSEEEQDDVVSVAAMLEMYDQLGTSEELKEKVAFPEAGHHVIGSHLTSEDLESVRKETYEFLEEVVGLKPVN